MIRQFEFRGRAPPVQVQPKLGPPSLQTKLKAIAGRLQQPPSGHAVTAPFLKGSGSGSKQTSGSGSKQTSACGATGEGEAGNTFSRSAGGERKSSISGTPLKIQDLNQTRPKRDYELDRNNMVCVWEIKYIYLAAFSPTGLWQLLFFRL